MRRNLEHRFLFPMAAIVMAVVVLGVQSSIAQQVATRSAYEVLSARPTEVVVRIHPTYTKEIVTDAATGESYTSVRFDGGITGTAAIGSPAEYYLNLGLLLASKDTKATFEIVSKKTESIDGILAPVAKYVHSSDMVLAEYRRNPESYGDHSAAEILSQDNATIVRTVYASNILIHPISYDVSAAKIELITDMTVKIKLPESHLIAASSISNSERSYYHSLFINGDITSFYRSAAAEIISNVARPIVSNKSSVQASEQWLSLTTGDEGVYRITADDLAKAGIATMDASTIAIYGYGAQELPESIDAQTGELRECAIDVIKKADGSLSEVRFFAPGPAEWRYIPQSSSTRLNSLIHIMNPYTTSGHFLLKIGGAVATKRITTIADTLGDAVPVTRNTVHTVSLYERDLTPEFPYISREFVGENIPVGRDLNITLADLPEYTGDSTILRPAFNSHATKPRTFNLSLNNKTLSTVIDYASATGDEGVSYTSRKWDSEIKVDPSFGAPRTLTISVTTDELSPSLWLNWVEVFYERATTLRSGAVPFMVIADASAYRYAFSNASSADVWDVTNPLSASRLAASSGENLEVTIKGAANSLRRFVAFRADQLKSPTISPASAPKLRSGVCAAGAEEIIITPEAFLEQANKYAVQRRLGGQATEPMSVAVVTLEDIYNEFGYGSHDGVAIRDFIKASVTNSTASGGTIPTFIALFGGGHIDFQNRTTQLPVYIPIYETWTQNVNRPQSYRTQEPEYVPDDGFYTKLTPGSDRLSLAVGRMFVSSKEEAEVITSKFIKYETSSAQGVWRSKAVFICDDRYSDNGVRTPDPLDHFNDTEHEIVNVADRIVVEKIYGQAYPTSFTASGRRKPEMEQALINAFNGGSAIISYIGHGNPYVWTHESILSVPSTISKLTNLNCLSFLTTATCDYTRFDNYEEKVSGGILMYKRAEGGVIGMLATSRSVQGGDSFATLFYKSLFDIPCDALYGTNPIGLAYLAGREGGWGVNSDKYFILGDPAQRVIIPRQYVVIDSINGEPYNDVAPSAKTIEALSLVTLSGHISNTCGGDAFDPSFNGSTNVTLYDAPTTVRATTTFTDRSPITDAWQTTGPILYSGAATVSGGRFTTSFVVSKDIKFDTTKARISLLAYSDDKRSALGAAENIRVFGMDTTRVNTDLHGPKLTLYIGSRAFHCGDIIPAHSTIIVDVEDLSGLNTSTSGIGHSFIGWTDDSTSGAVDLSPGYQAEPNDFTKGTSTVAASFPLGTHTLRVRAFDAAGNPAFADVEFTAKGEDPYTLYNVTVVPNPVSQLATFTFQQPASPESPVDVALEIYSSIGQLVRSINVKSLSSNLISIPFDSKDNGGVVLADGMYIYRLSVSQLSGVSTVAGGTFLIVHQQ